MNKAEEIVGVFREEKFRFKNAGGDVIVGGVVSHGKSISIKGPADDSRLQVGGTYRFLGRWGSYTNRYSGIAQPQFCYDTFVTQTPVSREGVITYLVKAPGIGLARAKQLWELFDTCTIAELREHPAAVAKHVKGLTPKLALEASQWLKDRECTEHAMVEILALVDGQGFPRSLPQDAIKTWGNRAARFIRQNPFKLLRFRGCGFAKCDQLYLRLGLDPSRIKRQTLCILNAIHRDTSGHTWLTGNEAIGRMKADVGGTTLNIPKAVQLGRRANLLHVKREAQGKLVDTGGNVFVTNKTRWSVEQAVADLVVAAGRSVSPWPPSLNLQGVSDHQQQGLEQAMRGQVGILRGSPGTGKTFAAASLVRLLLTRHSRSDIALCAPTGKAAVRLTQSMEAAGIPLRARTIHSMLGVKWFDGAGNWEFHFDGLEPLPYKYLVVDESSMLDTPLMYHLLAARAANTGVLFLGDIGQLPPVGHGAPLRDLLRAGVPSGELTELHRNSGRIVSACQEIRQGKAFQASKDIKLEQHENLKVVQASTPAQQIEKIKRSVRVATSQGHSKLDIQVLVPLNSASQVSREKLNAVLQEEITGRPPPGHKYQVGDKIVCLVNQNLAVGNAVAMRDKFTRDLEVLGLHSGATINAVNSRYDTLLSENFPDCAGDDCTWQEVEASYRAVMDLLESGYKTSGRASAFYVANGEVGVVTAMCEKTMEVELPSPRRCVRVPLYNEKVSNGSRVAAKSWDLAYALSVHKSQGSEWPVVIVVLDTVQSAKMICSREWIYTAISRAKKICLLVGDIATAHRFCKTTAINKRKTFLTELIREQGVFSNGQKTTKESRVDRSTAVPVHHPG